MLTDLLTNVQGWFERGFEVFQLFAAYLSDLRTSNWSWFLVVMMMLYVCIYATLIGPLYRYCRRFKINIMAFAFCSLVFVNLLLPFILWPLAIVGPDFWLPAVLFSLLYVLLLCTEGQNAQGDGAVVYMVHSHLLVFVILPSAIFIRLIIDVVRGITHVFFTISGTGA